MFSMRIEFVVLQCLVLLSVLIQLSTTLEILDVEFNATDQYHVTNYRLPKGMLIRQTIYQPPQSLKDNGKLSGISEL